jgi:restriction system protein
VDLTFHYPPELFQLLVAALPKLCRSKKDLLLFFRGAGVANDLVADLWETVAQDPNSIYKAEIARRVLTRLNERGEAALGERREVLRRVVEFEDFSVCWPDDQAAAKGHVADIRRVVDVKDSFTRMRQERDREHQAHTRQREARAAELRKRKAAREKVKNELYGLFKEGADPHQRGRDFEAVLNRLFKLDGILIRESFCRKKEDGQTVEQIDGAVEIAGHLYLVEVKWHKEPIDVQDVQVLLARLFLRPEARGIFIAANGYTQPAIEIQRQAASQKILLLCHLADIVQVLEREESFGDFFKSKSDLAMTELRSIG